MWPERAMGIGVFAAVTAMALILVQPSVAPPEGSVPLPLYARTGDFRDYQNGVEGAPLTIEDLDGDVPSSVHAVWDHERIIVLKLDADLAGHLDHALPHSRDPDAVLVAYSAISTHLGCTVHLYQSESPTSRWDKDGDGVSDGLLLDECHQGVWDPYNGGAHEPGTPGDGPLFALDLTIRPDGALFASRIDS